MPLDSEDRRIWTFEPTRRLSIHTAPPPELDTFTMTWHFEPLLERGTYRYKIFFGGRGSMKSQTIAKALITLAHQEKLLILCTREYQNSILDSVHREIVNQIAKLRLEEWFVIEKTKIYHKLTGSEFIFKGLHYSISEIKSMTGVDICWVEEAQSISKESLLVLDPTLRTANSEIWFSYNPDSENDPVYEFSVKKTPPNAYVCFVNWRDNPWFPKELEEQRQRMMQYDPENYDWVWEGTTRKNAAATILRGKVFVEHFETPNDMNLRFYHGVDWGFANDPTVMIRCFINPIVVDGKHVADDLYVDREAYGMHVDIDNTPALFDQIETARDWPSKADSSRPETISYIRRQGFYIEAAEKWPGSVEDGIAHLRGFRRIVVHPRCEKTAEEARLYSYKLDPKTNDVLPIVVDKNNHCIDSLRYALDGLILRRGNLGVWAKLARAAGGLPN